MSLYETLGVGREASGDEIRKAWRRESSKAHPDRKGGDGKRQQELNVAYAILCDADRRETYDRTGNTGPVKDLTQIARNTIVEEFGRAVENENVIDPIAAVVQELKKHVADITGHREQMKRKVRALERRVSRLKGPAEGNFLAEFMNQRLDQLRHSVGMFDESLEVLSISQELIRAYAYEVEQGVFVPGGIAFGWGPR